MPKIITTAQEVAYLATLAATGNATLAAVRAGVSRSWAYRKRAGDAGFAALFRAMAALFQEPPTASDRSAPPLPPAANATGVQCSPVPRTGCALPSLSREGRGAGRRVRVNRDRADGWTADKEAQFLDRLTDTCSVWLAAAEVGLTTHSAYRRRLARPGFAAAWAEAERAHWPPMDQPWIEAACAFLEGEPAPPGNPVRFTRVGEVLQAMRGNLFVPRRPRE